MIGTESLKSWYKSCGAIALAAVFALNSTSAWAANQTIAAGETVSGAVGTSSNLLNIYGTAIGATIESGTSGHDVFDGGTANNTTINAGLMNVNEGGTANDTTVNGGHLKVFSGAMAKKTTINDGVLNISGTANDTTVNGGQLYVYGTANNTTINDGELYVDKGRTANARCRYSFYYYGT